MATGRVNIGGGGSGKLNVFVQPDEPVIKEGIWLKSNSIFNKITNDNQLYFANDWTDPLLGIYSNSPVPYTNKNIYSTIIDGMIYVIFGTVQANSLTLHWLYKYNPVSDTWTLVTSSFPWLGIESSAMTAVGTDLYFMGGRHANNSPISYKYDTITDTWTRIADMPFSTGWAGIVEVGDDIFVFGGIGSYGGAYMNKAAKYNIITNAWTLLRDIPQATTTIHTNAYLYGGFIYFMYVNRMYKYDIENDTYVNKTIPNVPLTVTPHGHYGFFRLDDKFYIAGGRTTTNMMNTVIEYDITTETTKAGPKLPHFFSKDSGAPLVATEIIDNKVFLFGLFRYAGTESSSQRLASNEVIVFNVEAKRFDNGTVVLSKDYEVYGSNYYTELMTNGDGTFIGDNPLRLVTGFNDAHIYTDNDLKKPPAYFGDGKRWINFRA